MEKWTKNRENKTLVSRRYYPYNCLECYQELKNLKNKFLDFSWTSIWLLLVLKKVDEMMIQTAEIQASISSVAAAAAFHWLVS